MIRLNDLDGKTRENPIVILQAADDREGWIFLRKYMEYYMQYHNYDSYDEEDVVDTFELELRRYRFYKNKIKADELWVDWTTLFHVWDK